MGDSVEEFLAKHRHPQDGWMTSLMFSWTSMTEPPMSENCRKLLQFQQRDISTIEKTIQDA